jgi:hypothetical protein
MRGCVGIAQFYAEALSRAVDNAKAKDLAIHLNDWLALIQRFPILYVLWEDEVNGHLSVQIKGARSKEPPTSEQSDQWTALYALNLEEQLYRHFQCT